MRGRHAPLVGMGLAAVAALAAADESETRLRFNPFERPQLEAALRRDRAGRAEEPWSPVLRATLVAEDESMADLGGVLLEIGEETHGYRLLEVRPFQAVFERNGEQLVLDVTVAEESR